MRCRSQTRAMSARSELQLPGPSRTAGAAVLLRRRRLPRLGRVPDAARTRPGRRVRRRARPGPDSRRPVRRVRAAAGGQPGPRRAPPDWRRRWTRRCAVHSRCRRPALLLERAAAQPGAPAVDEVLGCPLLTVRQGRVSFTPRAVRPLSHRRAPGYRQRRTRPRSPASLEDPRHADLRELAVAIERDDDRRFGPAARSRRRRPARGRGQAGQFGAGVSARAAGRGRRPPHRGQGGHRRRGTATGQPRRPRLSRRPLADARPAQRPRGRPAQASPAAACAAGRFSPRWPRCWTPPTPGAQPRCAGCATRGTPRRSAPSSRPPTALAGPHPPVPTACRPAS